MPEGPTIKDHLDKIDEAAKNRRMGDSALETFTKNAKTRLKLAKTPEEIESVQNDISALAAYNMFKR